MQDTNRPTTPSAGATEEAIRGRWSLVIKDAFFDKFSPGLYFLVFGVAFFFFENPWQDAILIAAVLGLLVCLERLKRIQKGVKKVRREVKKVRRGERRRTQAGVWAARYYRELVIELPEEAREALEEITETKLYRWVEKYEGEIKRLPVAARQEIYEIAETRLYTRPCAPIL